MVIQLWKGKGKKTECMIYRGISLVSVIGIYVAVLVDRVCRVIGVLIDDEQGAPKHGRGV